MKQLLVVGSLLLLSSTSWAEVGWSTTTTPEPAKVLVTHQVDADRVNNEIKVENSIENKALMQKFLSKSILPKLKDLPGIKSVQLVEGKVKSEKGYSDFHNHSRDSHMVVKLDLVNPVSLMFKVSEKFRTCNEVKVVGEADYNDEDYVEVSPDCQLESAMDIEGPIAVYGTFAGTTNQELLLKNQITINFEYGMDYSKVNTEVDSTLSANRIDFSRAIQTVLNWSKVGIQIDDPVRVTLVQAGRVLKKINEDLLKGK